jgi:hypothetical protein
MQVLIHQMHLKYSPPQGFQLWETITFYFSFYQGTGLPEYFKNVMTGCFKIEEQEKDVTTRHTADMGFEDKCFSAVQKEKGVTLPECTSKFEDRASLNLTAREDNNN